jgi:hypothetical protein
MKVICISIEGLKWDIGLTLSKTYDVLSLGEDYARQNPYRKTFRIRNDNSKCSYYDRRFVIPLYEYRQNKIEELLC